MYTPNGKNLRFIDGGKNKTPTKVRNREELEDAHEARIVEK